MVDAVKIALMIFILAALIKTQRVQVTVHQTPQMQPRESSYTHITGDGVYEFE